MQILYIPGIILDGSCSFDFEKSLGGRRHYKFNHIMYRAPKKRKSYSQKIDFEISKKTCSFIPSTKKYRNMGPSTMSITFIVLFPEARRYVGRYVPTATLP